MNPHWIIRSMPRDLSVLGLAARFHRNLCRVQVTWTTDEGATRFATAEDAFARAIEHGLKDHEFVVAAVWNYRNDECRMTSHETEEVA
mgnify:CR=1 FL=1